MQSIKYRALVVDDEAAIRKLLVGALRKQGFDADEASDGSIAAELVAKSQYDVVISDLKMPNKNGHALALEILQQESRPLIVVHTGVLEPKLAEDLLKRGVDDIVYKPTDFRLIAAKIKGMVDRQPAFIGRFSEAMRHPREAARSTDAGRGGRNQISLPQINLKLSQIATILPVSRAALDVYEMTRRDDWNVSQIAAAIQRDASLVVQVLRLGNSTLYNPAGRRITSLDEAVLRVGQKRIGELALATNALSAVTPSLLPWMDLELAWKRSMAAGIALELVLESGGHHHVEESLLLSAIMHPLGRVAAAMMFPKHYGTMIERCKETGESLKEQERHVFPVSLSEITAQLLATWQIPPELFLPLKMAADDYPALARLSEPTRTMAELVKVAIQLGRLALDHWETWDYVNLPGPRVLERLRIRNVSDIMRQTRLDVAKLAAFHAGEKPYTTPMRPAPAHQGVPYCSLSADGSDLVREILPSLGLRPCDRSLDDIAHRHEPAIVNALGDGANLINFEDARNRIVAVTNHENRDAVDRICLTAILPNSFARFRQSIFAVLNQEEHEFAEAASS